MKYKYLYILDYSNATINEINLQNLDNHLEALESWEELIDEFGFNSDECYYMLSDEKLSIIEIEKPLK